MKPNKSYEDFVRNTDKYMGKTYRSLSEANRDAQYACAIQTFKSDFKLAMEFIGQAILGGLWVLVFVGGAIGLIYWLTK